MANEIPLWEKNQQEYLNKYKAANYPAKQSEYEAQLAKARSTNLQGEPLAVILYKLADSLFNQYKFLQAEPYYSEMVNIREKESDCDAKVLADSYYRLGMCVKAHAQQGDKSSLPAAINLFQKSIDLLEKKYGPDCPELMAPISGLSVATLQSGDWQKGALIQQRLSKIMAKQFGYNSTVNAMHHRVLGSTEQSAGMNNDAQKDLDIYEQIKAKLPPGSLPPDSYAEWSQWVETRLKSREKPTWMTNNAGTHIPESANLPVAKPDKSVPKANYSENLPNKENVPLPVKAPAGRKFYVQGQEVSYQKYCAVKLFNESLHLIADNKENDAQKKLQEAILLDPQMPEVHCQLGQLLAKAGDYNSALSELNSAVALDKSISEAWAIMANIFQSKGDLNGSINAYKQFISLSRDSEMCSRAESAVRLLQKEVDSRKIPSKLADLPGTNEKVDYLADISRGCVARWADRNMPIKVFVHKNSSAQGYDPQFDLQLKQSLQDWTNASGNKIKFSFVENPAQANMDILWTSDLKQFTEAAEGGEARTNIQGSHIDRADILLLTCSEPDNKSISPTRIKAVALHEVGHALGLLGHSPVPADIMYCAEGLSEAPQQLTDRDKRTIYLLYSWQQK